MQNENATDKTLTKRCRQCFTKIKSCFFLVSCNEIKKIFEPYSKRTLIKLILICILLLSSIYLFLYRDAISKNFSYKIQPKSTPKPIPIQTQAKAYIITAACDSLRFNATKENLERVFLNFFNISCFISIPLNDSRIHTGNVPIWKKFSSNLLAFIEIWTYDIQKYSKNEYEWTFVFEDDINFENPKKVYLPNYIEPLQEIMHIPEIRNNDGFFFLGLCGPTFPNGSRIIVAKNTNNTLRSEKGYGFCLHATAITTKRAKLFWTEISSYRPNNADASLDLQLREYSIRSKNHFYTLGSNLQYPPGTGHYGLCYQDRGRLSTTVT